MNAIPWLLSLATAIWFGLMARRAERSWLLWSIGGAVLALTVATILTGLLQAGFVPLSHEAIVSFRIESAAAAAVTVGALGLVVTLGLFLSQGGSREEPRRPNRPA